jgi:hypothetical protein
MDCVLDEELVMPKLDASALPPEVIEALGTDPQREALEALLLRLVQQGKLTLAKAGEQLGMTNGDRRECPW